MIKLFLLTVTMIISTVCFGTSSVCSDSGVDTPIYVASGKNVIFNNLGWGGSADETYRCVLSSVSGESPGIGANVYCNPRCSVPVSGSSMSVACEKGEILSIMATGVYPTGVGVMGNYQVYKTTDVTTCDAVESPGYVNYFVAGASKTRVCSNNFSVPSGFISSFVPSIKDGMQGKFDAYYSCDGGAHKRVCVGRTVSCENGQTMTIGLNGSSWNETTIGYLQGSVKVSNVVNEASSKTSILGMLGIVGMGFLFNQYPAN